MCEDEYKRPILSRMHFWIYEVDIKQAVAQKRDLNSHICCWFGCSTFLHLEASVGKLFRVGAIDQVISATFFVLLFLVVFLSKKCACIFNSYAIWFILILMGMFSMPYHWALPFYGNIGFADLIYYYFLKMYYCYQFSILLWYLACI